MGRTDKCTQNVQNSQKIYYYINESNKTKNVLRKINREKPI